METTRIQTRSGRISPEQLACRLEQLAQKIRQASTLVGTVETTPYGSTAPGMAANGATTACALPDLHRWNGFCNFAKRKLQEAKTMTTIATNSKSQTKQATPKRLSKIGEHWTKTGKPILEVKHYNLRAILK